MEWLAVAWVSTDVASAEALRRLRAMCALEGERSRAAARLGAIAGMAAALRSPCSDGFARDLFRFRQAGLSIDHLQLLAESLSRPTDGPIVIRL